jgi:hypothetical protein
MKEKDGMISFNSDRTKDPATPGGIDDQYQRIFQAINGTLFDGELQPITILAKQGPALACFIYKEGSRPVIYLQHEGSRISASEAESLFHESVHYYCYLNRIQDCDLIEASGTYFHNEKFKAAAEAHGARCSFLNAQYGFACVELPPDLLSLIMDQADALKAA